MTDLSESATPATAATREDAPMANPRFLRPKSLYVEVVGIDQDGNEVVMRAKYEALDRDSEFSWDDHTFADTDDDWRPAVRLTKPPLHNINIHFTRVNAADAVPHGT